MNDRTINSVLLSSVLLAFATAYPVKAQTSASAEEIQQLQKKLRDLEQKLEKLTGDSASPVNGTEVSNNGRSVIVHSSDDSFSFQFGGRLQLDAAAYDARINDFGNGSKVRRLFLDARGTFSKNWHYRIQYDLARNLLLILPAVVFAIPGCNMPD